MSYPTVMYAWDTQWGGTSSEKLAIVKLAELCSPIGFGAMPSNDYLASKLELSVSSIKKITRSLEKQGIFLKFKGKGLKTKTGYTNGYVFAAYRQAMGMHPANFSESDWEKVPSFRGGTHGTPESEGVPHSTPPNAQGVEHAAPQGVEHAAPIIEDINRSKDLIEDIAPPTDRPTTTKELHKHPAVMAYRETFRRSMKRTQYPHVQHIDNIDKWTKVLTEWLLRGYNPTNLSGMLDWYRTGIPERFQKKPKVDTSRTDAWTVLPPLPPAEAAAQKAFLMQEAERVFG